MFKLAKTFHTELSEEEKEPYSLKNVKSNYFGYKHFGENAVNAKGTRGGSSTYNIQKPAPCTPARPQPPMFADEWDFLTAFAQDSHRIAMKLMRYIARACGIDEEVLLKLHEYGRPSGDHLRMMHYPADRNGESDQEAEVLHRLAEQGLAFVEF